LTGAVRSEWFWDAALAAEAHGYIYYTRVRIENCAPYGHNEFGRSKALLKANYAATDPAADGEVLLSVDAGGVLARRRLFKMIAQEAAMS
jgi:hypothetical protein